MSKQNRFVGQSQPLGIKVRSLSWNSSCVIPINSLWFQVLSTCPAPSPPLIPEAVEP